MESTADDYALALQLSMDDSSSVGGLLSAMTRPELKEISNSASNERFSPVIDHTWELIDPNPDARELFVQFNRKYFWDKLNGVEVRWSSRMTLCAGVCSYEGHGGLCSIRLSEPLLKFRPRKDLVETLLHEMIHAYLFVTNNDRDHDAHGPEFLNHMHRLNKLTGANITVYHTFHDEVENYRVHWWLCNGPCRKRPPFFGYVKRAMNRPPSSRDPWWSQHQLTCGGVFEKVKEPEKKSRRTTSEKEKLPEKSSGLHSINKWFPVGRDSKSVKKAAGESETVKTFGGQSGGIWGDFDSDSVSDAVLLKAADAAERRDVSTKLGRSESELHFPGQGRKLCDAMHTSGQLGTIVRRIPGVGVISGRDHNSQRTDNLTGKQTANAATSAPSQCRLSSDMLPVLPSSDKCKAANKAVDPPVKFESVAEFRKTVGMVLSPTGTEVRVKNFVSVCNHNARRLLSSKDKLVTPRPKETRPLSDDDINVAARPTKRLRSDVEDTKSNATESNLVKKSVDDHHLPRLMDRSLSIVDDNYNYVVMVDSDTENCDITNDKPSQQNVQEALTTLGSSNTQSTVRDTSVEEAVASGFDQSVGDIEQTDDVICPVCQLSVSSIVINEHLDQCLA